MPKISDAKVAILSTNGFEQSELEVPRDKLRSAGATVHVVTPDGEAIKGWEKTDWGSAVEADLPLSAVNVSDYDALVLPGGKGDAVLDHPRARFGQAQHAAARAAAQALDQAPGDQRRHHAADLRVIEKTLPRQRRRRRHAEVGDRR